MAPSLARLLVLAAAASALAVTGNAAHAPHRSEDHDQSGTTATDGGARALGKARNDGSGDEDIVLKEGIVFQKHGCPQAVSEVQARKTTRNTSLPGNVIRLTSAGPGRAGNHFLTVSAYFAMAYCCKSRVLNLPVFDRSLPAEHGQFRSQQHYFDFSGVDMLPLEEYEGMSEDPDVCPPIFEDGGMTAFHLKGIHSHLLECMNRVYLRGCEKKYFEPLLDTQDFCEKPPASGRRLDRTGDHAGRHHGGGGRAVPGAPPPAGAGRPPRMPAGNAAEAALLESRKSLRQSGSEAEAPGRDLWPIISQEGATSGRFDRGGKGTAGSLVMHIRSGDIFLVKNVERMKFSFPGFGQPPLQFYLRAIASQPWSDVTIITFARNPAELNPTFAALEMMNRSGLLGPNVAMHKDRDLLEDLQSMLCADGLAISRSTLHFMTFAHTRAKHYFVPSECGPGTYTRQTRAKLDGTKKPNPNNTTLLCIENPEAEVYGVEWEVDEDAYGIYNGWKASDDQLLDMVVFDGITGLAQCCPR